MVWGTRLWGTGVLVFSCVWGLRVEAGKTPLSNCPQLLATKRFVSTLAEHPEWTEEDIVRLYFQSQRDEVRSLIPQLQALFDEDSAAIKSEYVSSETREDLQIHQAQVEALMDLAEKYTPFDRDVQAELELIRNHSVGTLVSHYVRFTSTTKFDELGFQLSISERSRALLSAVLRKVKPARITEYIPADREPEPSAGLRDRLVTELTFLGGRAPSPSLIERLWRAPLVRDDLYSSRWGRVEYYWELVQNNPHVDLEDDQVRNAIGRHIDKLEEILLRPKK